MVIHQRVVYLRNRPISKKKRRNSGRGYGDCTISMPKKYIINNCLEPQVFWDDWNDYRDGIRDCLDRTKINRSPWFIENDGFYYWNAKNKKLVKRRKAKKWRIERGVA